MDEIDAAILAEIQGPRRNNKPLSQRPPRGDSFGPAEDFAPLDIRWGDAQQLYGDRACRFPTPLELRSKESNSMSRSLSMPSFASSFSSRTKSPKRTVPSWEQDPEEANQAGSTGGVPKVPGGERDTLQWIFTDRRFHPSAPSLDNPEWPSPYCNYKPKVGRLPHELWLPELACYPKKKGEDNKEGSSSPGKGPAAAADGAGGKGSGKGKEKGADAAQTSASAPSPAEDSSPSSTARPRWFPRHHITDSHCNTELQVGLRNYFGLAGSADCGNKPKPELVEPYNYTDRCMQFPDHRTVFDTVRYGGVKETQLQSRWRIEYKKKRSVQEINPKVGWMDGLKLSKKLKQIIEKKKKPEPKRRPKADSGSSEHGELLKRVASLSPDRSVQYWRDWSKESKLRLPEDPKKKKKKKKKGEEEIVPEKPPESPRIPRRWDPRFAVLMSKDNTVLHDHHRFYFSKPKLLSGIEYGECERLLAMPSNKWKGLK